MCLKVDSICFPGFCALTTDHVFKCQNDILISSLHEEDDLVRSAIKKQLFNKALRHPLGRGLTVATAYYK